MSVDSIGMCSYVLIYYFITEDMAVGLLFKTFVTWAVFSLIFCALQIFLNVPFSWPVVDMVIIVLSQIWFTLRRVKFRDKVKLEYVVRILAFSSFADIIMNLWKSGVFSNIYNWR